MAPGRAHLRSAPPGLRAHRDDGLQGRARGAGERARDAQGRGRADAGRCRPADRLRRAGPSMVSPASRVLITGANRGLGLEFARQYAAEGWQVLATVRDLDGAGELRALRGKVDIAHLDAADDGSLEAFLRDVGSAPLDLLIANAGVGSGGEKPASAVTREEWREAISVNTYAPFRLAAALR